MKRILALLLTAMMVMGMAGCGGQASSTAVPDESDDVPVQSDTGGTPDAETATSSGEIAEPEQTPESEPEEPIFGITDQLVYEDEFVQVTLDSLEKIENDDIRFKLSHAFVLDADDESVYDKLNDGFYLLVLTVEVNGYCIPTRSDESVQDQYVISRSELDRCGIEEADEIILWLGYDLGVDLGLGWEYIGRNFSAAFYPTGLSPEEVVYPERMRSDTEEVIYEDENCSYIIVEKTENGFEAIVENKTDHPLDMTIGRIAVDGVDFPRNFYSRTVAPGAKLYDSFDYSHWKNHRRRLPSRCR